MCHLIGYKCTCTNGCNAFFMEWKTLLLSSHTKHVLEGICLKQNVKSHVLNLHSLATISLTIPVSTASWE